MSQDETGEAKVEPTTPPAPEETNTQEDNASQVDETAESVASAEQTNEIDYKAELEAARTQLSQAEHTIVETKRKLKEATSTGPDDVVIEPVTEPTSDELAAQIRAENQADLTKFKQELTQDVLEEELSNLSKNPYEQALIQLHYENSIKQSGYSRKAIQADLKAARAIANQKRLEKENSELKQTLIAKNTAGKAAGGSNQDQQVIEDEPNLTPAERAFLKRQADKQGISLKEYLRRNKNKLTTTTNG